MIEKILNIFSQIKLEMENKDSFKAIKITTSQVSAIIESEGTMQMTDLENISKVLRPDFIHFIEDQFILSCYDYTEKEIYTDNEEFKFLIDICSQLGEYICSCTGNEFFITDTQIMVFLDVNELTLHQYQGINNIFKKEGRIIFSDRPYILYE